jgi:hypothetical protein
MIADETLKAGAVAGNDEEKGRAGVGYRRPEMHALGRLEQVRGVSGPFMELWTGRSQIQRG